MDETSDNPGKALSTAVLRALRPAMPAVIGAAALTFLFAALMPFSWVAGIGWNLYLDRLSDFFVPPVGNAARLALALGMAGVAAVIAGLIAVLIAKPEAAGLSSLRRRFSRTADADAEVDDGGILTRRRRVDRHPDDPPRPPIRAGRDLPAGGLGPLTAPTVDEPVAADPWLADLPEEDDGDELMLADLAPVDAVETGDEPWLQPAEMTTPPASTPDPSDKSLGAMVARFEAGLARRRQNPEVSATILASDDAAPEGDDGEPEVDYALEAALSTLQRMTRQSVG
jgi:hypothetical protein